MLKVIYIISTRYFTFTFKVLMSNVTDRPKEAEECYMKALSLKSDHVDTNMNAGHMYRIQKRWDEAKERYETVLRRRPGFFKIRHHLGFVNEQLEQYKVT